jgi:hypothetical protein
VIKGKWYVYVIVKVTNPHWARVVGYGPYSLCILKEGLCPNSGDINILMMMMIVNITLPTTTRKTADMIGDNVSHCSLSRMFNLW